jgi:hypothetical protein
MGVLSSTSWFITNLFIYLLFFVVVSRVGRKSTTKCNQTTKLPWHNELAKTRTPEILNIRTVNKEKLEVKQFPETQEEWNEDHEKEFRKKSPEGLAAFQRQARHKEVITTGIWEHIFQNDTPSHSDIKPRTH